MKNQAFDDCQLGRHRPHLMKEQLLSRIVGVQQRFYKLVRSDVRRIAYEPAVKRDLRHPFDSKTKIAGETGRLLS